MKDLQIKGVYQLLGVTPKRWLTPKSEWRAEHPFAGRDTRHRVHSSKSQFLIIKAPHLGLLLDVHSCSILSCKADYLVRYSGNDLNNGYFEYLTESNTGQVCFLDPVSATVAPGQLRLFEST